jgi:hypothetical protein
MKFTVQFAEDEYRIVGSGGQLGACAPYGQPAAVAIGADIYYALVVEADEVEEGGQVTVYCVQTVLELSAATEEVTFSDDGAGIALVDEEEDEEEEVV